MVTEQNATNNAATSPASTVPSRRATKDDVDNAELLVTVEVPVEEEEEVEEQQEEAAATPPSSW